MKSVRESLRLNEVTVRPELQRRADGTDPEYVAELAAVLRADPKAELTPIVVWAENVLRGPYLLSDGHHTLEAYRLAGRKTVPADIRKGGLADAVLHSLSANERHGRRRTNADRRKAVGDALTLFPDKSDRQIDAICGVAPGYTSELKRRQTGQVDPVKSAAGSARHEKEEASGSDRETTGESTAGGTADFRGSDGRPDDGIQSAAGVVDESGLSDREETTAGVVLDRDSLGRVIPGYLVSVFEAGRVLLRSVRQAKTAVQSANRGEPLAGLTTRSPMLVPVCDQAIQMASRQVPYCVCPACDGDGDSEECPTCGGCGWLTSGQFSELPSVMQEKAHSFRPGDSWEGDEFVESSVTVDRPFKPIGPGLDAMGQKIPKSLRDFFADDSLGEAACQLRAIASAVRSAAYWNPHLAVSIPGDLEELAGKVAQARPYAVCECGGVGCEACATAGFIPSWMAVDQGVA